MNRCARTRAAAAVTLTEPELWAIIRGCGLSVTPVSPFALMARSSSTLDQLLAAGRAGLQTQNLMDGDRTNSVLAAAVNVLCSPEECISLVERGALGTLMRAFYGANDLFVGHVPLAGSHTLVFPYTRATLLGVGASALELAPTAGSVTSG